MKKIKKDMDRLNKYYLNVNPDSFLTDKFKILRNKMRESSLLTGRTSKKMANGPSPSMDDWLKLVKISENWLNMKYSESRPSFIWDKK